MAAWLRPQSKIRYECMEAADRRVVHIPSATMRAVRDSRASLDFFYFKRVLRGESLVDEAPLVATACNSLMRP